MFQNSLLARLCVDLWRILLLYLIQKSSALPYRSSWEADSFDYPGGARREQCQSNGYNQTQTAAGRSTQVFLNSLQRVAMRMPLEHSTSILEIINYSKTI